MKMKNLLKELFPFMLITILLIIIAYLIIGFVSWDWTWITSNKIGYIFTRAIILIFSMIYANLLTNKI